MDKTFTVGSQDALCLATTIHRLFQERKARNSTLEKGIKLNPTSGTLIALCLIKQHWLLIIMFTLFIFSALLSAPPKQRMAEIPKFYAEVPKVRIKDIAHFEGVRENSLVGYGLVVGLNGTGDDFSTTPHAKESLISMLERLGVNVRDLPLTGKNIAAVMVTAQLPAFSRQGSRIDVTVSAIGSAKDLKGGTLLVTPLLAADGEVYAVGQGPVATTSIHAEGKTASTNKGIPTNGKIANGAIVEKQINFELSSLNSMTISLNNPDFTTAHRLAETINTHFKKPIAKAIDPASVKLKTLSNDPVSFLMDIERLPFKPDQVARVVIDEQNGVIVMGHRVKIMPVAICHGTITIRIHEQPIISQPEAGTNIALASGNNNTITSGGGQTIFTHDTDVDVQESQGGFTVLESGAYLDEFVGALNLLGVSPREMIAILQTIKAAGALQADLVFT